MTSQEAQLLQAIDMLHSATNYRTSKNKVKDVMNRNPFEIALVGKKAGANLQRTILNVSTPGSSNFDNQLQAMEELSGAINEAQKNTIDQKENIN